MESHIEEEDEGNRKNGKGRKQVKTSIGTVDINPPRDRNGTFEPEIIPKRHKTLGVDLDRQIIALYARGASYSDIRDHLMDVYGLEASTATISRVTDKSCRLYRNGVAGRRSGFIRLFGWMPSIIRYAMKAGL